MNSIFFYNEKTNSYFAYKSDGKGAKFTVRFVPEEGKVFDVEMPQKDFIQFIKESSLVEDEKELARLYLLDFTEVIENEEINP